MRLNGRGVLLLAALLTVACSREQAAESAGQADVGSPQAAVPGQARNRTLAYEHTVAIVLPGEDIPARIDAMQQACFSQSVGECEVLDVHQQGGEHPSGSIRMRVAPKGVDLLVHQASGGGEIAERTTSAQDLAEAVAQNTQRRTRLENEHARLLEFQAKPNVSLEDMLKLSERLADVEAQLDTTHQEAAQHQRRIAYPLLTVAFRPQGVEVGGSAIGEAVRDSVEIASVSTAGMIRLLAGMLPVAAVAWLAWMAWRFLRRRRVARGVPAS